MGKSRVNIGFCWENLRERSQIEYLDVDGRIILKWVFDVWDGGTWTGLVWLRIRLGGGDLFKA
jgi:hypothetical protein